nr:ferrous iron transport protein B [Candidatus Njordarchaeota archaeon]
MNHGKRSIRIALAGNANVGKSVIFNQLTGLHQHIGNWAGKTVERAEGTLHFKGHTIDVIDLPGIYSLSTSSDEESISREFIVDEKPDLVINVIDATLLERNLVFTLQLLQLDTPLIVALNEMDLVRRKGIKINIEKLKEYLGVPVIPTVAVKGTGIHELLSEALSVIEEKQRYETRESGKGKRVGRIGKKQKEAHKAARIRHGSEVEQRIEILTKVLTPCEIKYPRRFVAIKLLEGDKEITEEVRRSCLEAISTAKKLADQLERIHGHDPPTIMISERYEIARSIAGNVQEIRSPEKPLLEERLDDITTHRILGYLLMFLTLLSTFLAVFTFGGYFSGLLTTWFYGWHSGFVGTFGVGATSELLWGAFEGLIAGITIVLPFIVPFYIILHVLEDSGYINRIAFLMDRMMHKMGLHGKAFVPVILAYGCNVPACVGCRVMETKRERLLAAFVSTLIPCSARTVVILGMVGTFIGIQWALSLYALNLLIVFLLGRLAFKALPGEPTALIMEMPDYKAPRARVVLKETWFDVLEFVKIAMPIVILGGFIIKLMELGGVLEVISNALSPLIVFWLGLPALSGIALFFGILRKELTLVMLATVLGTTDFSLVMTPVQMIVFTIVVLFYVPCLATITVLTKGFGGKNAILITGFEMFFAFAIGGVALRLLTFFV